MSSLKNPAERHVDELERSVDLGGKAVLDIGCGGGMFLRKLIDRGGDAVGLDIDEAQFARAEALGIPQSKLRVGRAESLPFAAASFDIVCCIFSFHHIPIELQDRALAEASRVLRPQGCLYIVEPTPDGALTEVMKPIEDETEVRTLSHARFAAASLAQMVKRAESRYEVARTFGNVDDVIKMLIDVDPTRASAAADLDVRREVGKRFERHARPANDTYVLTQPCVAYVFTRTGMG